MIEIRTARTRRRQRLESLMRTILKKFFEVREGECTLSLQAFLTLFLIVAAHTILETARDTLFLARLAPAGLNLMSIATAGLTCFVNATAIAIARRLGHCRALIGILIVVAGVTTALGFVARSARGACAVYLFSGLEGVVLMPQFWLLAAQLFTLAQGRRVFSFVASGGVAGGAFGAGASAVLLHSFPTRALLPIAGACFLLAACTLGTLPCNRHPTPGLPIPALLRMRPLHTNAGRDNPYLVRVVAMGALSAAAILIVDYLFKCAAVRCIPASHLGGFFARFYIILNIVSLGVQVVLTQPALRRLGVIGAAGILPFLLLGGGIATFLGGGALAVVVGLKIAEAALCYSLNRVATELLYVPVPETLRDQTRGVAESVIGRGVKACTGGLLYLLTLRTLATPRVLALLVVILSLASASLTLNLRRSYLDLVSRYDTRSNDTTLNKA